MGREGGQTDFYMGFGTEKPQRACDHDRSALVGNAKSTGAYRDYRR